jgi:predicted Rossmann fold nucleotide-binding protein DprA/Smf involved in DNA uptake
MTPAPITLPPRLAHRIAPEAAARILGIGNAALLDEPLLGFIASRQCPGHVLIETLDRVPQWAQEQRVILSGFHSPLEQQVLRSLLRRNGRAVKLLARGITDYHADEQEREPLATGRMLVITACPATVARTTRASALERNQLVLTLANEILAPHIATDSPLTAMIQLTQTGAIRNAP